MAQQAQVIWFKRDLRVNDHAALTEAAALGQIIPLYIIERELWSQPDSSWRHWHFIHDSLQDLQSDLLKLGTSLIIRMGEATDVLEQIRCQIGSFTLWSHEETGNAWTYKRDIEVAQWCREHNVVWHEKPTNGVVRRLKNRDGWAKLRDNRMAQKPLPIPPLISFKHSIESCPLPSKNDLVLGSSIIGSVQKGGRKEAIKTLTSFLNERGRHYMQSISKPGVSARHCSRLSAHITYGTISIKEIEHAVKDKITILDGNNDANAIYFKRNLIAFLSRLAWHCHFIQKLEQQPDIEFKCMHPAFEGMREPYFREDYFEAWKTGNTGYPLIDACMRSLHENGWITFRMRAMLVSFASYHLWLDWRQTAPFLAQLFTDYEPGIHYSQFQMQSGVTGINTIRIYNPIKQSYDQDPQAKFIRRYLPELKHIPDSFIHEPWRSNVQNMSYPYPIIDHEVAIKYARDEISKRWKRDGFRDQSIAVNEKLGSRNRQPNRVKLNKAKDSKQLSLDI